MHLTIELYWQWQTDRKLCMIYQMVSFSIGPYLELRFQGPAIIHRVQKKGATDFFAVTFTNMTDFHNFSCTTLQENAKVIDVKISCHTFIMLLPYRVKISDTKVTHFTPILALCTYLCLSHLQKPVSTKQTKHSRKLEAQNLCSKCPPFTRTHAFKRLRHCAIADGFGGSVQSWCYAATLLGNRG